MLRHPVSIVLTALVLATACNEADPKAITDQGTAALASGDYPAAVRSFDKALGAMQADDPNFLRASMGKCQALARTDPAQAKTEFLALSKAHPSRIKEPDFNTMVSELVKKDALVEAAEVMDAGVRMFPESPQMMQMKELVIEASKKSKSSGAMDKLKGLGYVGSDDQ